jgi:metallothiol transferase
VFQAKLLVKGRTTAYFDLDGLWLALNEEKCIPRKDIHSSYTHIAFSAYPEEINELEKKLTTLGVQILKSRIRNERDENSLYFCDPDGHKFEFHSGNLTKRLNYYREEKPHMTFFDR